MVMDMNVLVSWICGHVVWLVRYLHIRGTSYLLLQGWIWKLFNVGTRGDW